MDLQYHVSTSKVKQELIIDTLSPELKMFLQGSTETVNDNDMSTSMFGLMESMILPENSNFGQEPTW